MTKDDKCLRETVLAELRRRRALLGRSEERTSREPGSDSRAAGAENEHQRAPLSPR